MRVCLAVPTLASGPHAAPLAAAAAAGGPGNKRQRTTGPDAGRTTAVSEAPQCPAGVAKRLRELRMGRARRRHMSDATIGVGLAGEASALLQTQRSLPAPSLNDVT